MKPCITPHQTNIEKQLLSLIFILFTSCFFARMAYAQPDQVACPPTITIACTDNLGPFPTDANYNPALGVPTVLITCELVTFTYQDVIIPGPCSSTYTIERNWDGSGDCSGDCSATLECTQIINVVDNEPPTGLTIINQPPLECNDPNVPSLVMEWANLAAASAVVTDNCSNATVSHDFTLDEALLPLNECISSNGIAYYIIRFTAVDDCGNIHSMFRNVFVQDNTPPSISCNNLTINCSDPNRDQLISNWLNSITATDACQGSVPVSNNYDPFAFYAFDDANGCGLKAIVEFEAQDLCSNDAVCIGEIYLIDDTPPVVTTPDDLYLECSDPNIAGKITQWKQMFTITEDCSTTESEAFEGPMINGNCPANSSRTYTVNAIDGCGNRTLVTRTIFIEDNTPPALTCNSQHLVLECDDPATDIKIMYWLMGVAADDNCDPSVGVSNTYQPDGFNSSCGLIGNQEVVFTSTDACGNTSTCRGLITITPKAPTIICHPDQFVSCVADIIVPNKALGGESCLNIADVTTSDLVLVSGMANCDGAIYEVTRTLTDICGQQASCTERYFIQNAEPVIRCPLGYSVTCSNEITVAPSDAIYRTSCGINAAVTVAGPFINGPKDCPGTTYTYRYTVMDDCNRVASCERTFTIANTAPTISVTPLTTVECKEHIQVSSADAQVTTSCGINASISISDPIQQGPEYCPGTTYTYTYTVRDACGRSASADRTFVIENEGPQFTVAPDITVHCIDDIQVSTADVSVLTACGQDYTVTLDEPELHPDYNCTTVTLPYIYTVTDACGRSDVAVRLITVEHKDPFIETPEPMTMDCFDEEELEARFPFAYSYCGNLEYTMDISKPEVYSPAHSDCSYEIYTVIYSVIDDCGVMVCVATKLTIENELVVFDPAPKDTIVDCGSIPEAAKVTAYGPCGGDLDLVLTENIHTKGGTDYIIERIWSAESACGSLYEHVQQIEVQCNDTTPSDNQETKPRNSVTKLSKANSETVVTLFPNPVQNQLQVSFDYFDIATQANIRIFGLDGREVLSRSEGVQKGANQLRLDLSTLPSGTYLLLLNINGEFTHSQQFIKIKY